jgi:integrase
MTTLVVHRRASEGGGGQLVDAFDAQALAIAATAAAPNTRRAYATAYCAFGVVLRACYGEASSAVITVGAVAAWCDELTAQGLAPSSVAQRVSAVRRLAAMLGADPLVQQVRCTHVQHDKPRALSELELDRLLRQPDRRTDIGIRDRAILELLARAGLRRAELARLTLNDIRSTVVSPTRAGAPRSRPGAVRRPGWRLWCVHPSAAGRGPCRCTPRRMTRCAAGTQAGPQPRPMHCS